MAEPRWAEPVPRRNVKVIHILTTVCFHGDHVEVGGIGKIWYLIKIKILRYNY